MNNEKNEGANARIASVNGEGDDGFRVIKTTAISNITEVRYYDETIEHIREQHAEFSSYFPSLDHAICDAIENPTHVYQASTSPQSSGFRYVSSSTTYDDNLLVVIVKPIATTSGLVKTAYFTGHVPGNLLYLGTPTSEPEVND